MLSCSVLFAAACSEATSTEERSTAPTAASSPTEGSTSTPDPDVVTVDGQVLGLGTYPAFTLEMPSTWAVNGAFVTKGVIGVSVWDVGQVPGHPCHWQDTLSDPGPSVDALVDALTTQRFRHATDPTDVTLGGYQGRSLTWSVPNDWVVTGDAEFKGCDVETSSGLRDFVSWFGNGYGERNQQYAGQVDMLWVLDVDGQRLLVDATYSPDTTKANRAELMGIVESLRFTDLSE
jgi:hypothetical protein